MGGMAAVPVRIGAGRGRARLRLGHDRGVSDRLQHRTCRAAVVGAARGLAPWRAGEPRAPPSRASPGDRAARSGDGVRRRTRVAARGALSGRAVSALGTARRGRHRGGGVSPAALARRPPERIAHRAGIGRGGLGGGMGMAVVERDARIVNPLGMHVRPGAEFVKVANKFKSIVEIHKDGAVVNGKSILGMMTLAAEYGSSIRIKTDGEDAEQAMAALCDLVAAGFNDMHLKPAKE